jgi:hypothetical protein
MVGILFCASTGNGNKSPHSHEERAYEHEGGAEKELQASKKNHISKEILQKAVFAAQANRSPAAAGAERHPTRPHKRTKHAFKQDLIHEHMQTVWQPYYR